MLRIKQNKVKSKFSTIPNALITDESLSSKERMIVVYLFSRPEDWIVRRSDIKKVIGIKDNTTYANYWTNIYNSGWVEKSNIKDSKGQFNGYNITLNSERIAMNIRKYREKPDNGKNPTSGKTRQREKPDVGKNPTLTNTDLLTNKEQLKKGKQKTIFETIEADTQQRKKDWAAKKERESKLAKPTNKFIESLLKLPVIENSDSRFEMLDIYKKWVTSKKGISQMNSLAGVEMTEYQRLQTIAEFVMNANYFLVREGRVNKLGGWIRVILNKKEKDNGSQKNNRLGISANSVKWVVEQLKADRAGQA